MIGKIALSKLDDEIMKILSNDTPRMASITEALRDPKSDVHIVAKAAFNAAMELVTMAATGCVKRPKSYVKKD